MRWEIKIDKLNPIIVDLPTDFGYDSWLPIKINKEPYHLLWHSGFKNVFLRDSKGLEHSVKIRNFETSQFPGESHRTCRLELACPSPSLIDRLETTVEPFVPGGAFRKKEGAEGGATVRSPMVGKVISVLVKNGAKVTKGQELCIIEAMKMENKILATVPGIIADVKAVAGNQVGIGDQLLKIKPEEA